MNQDDEKSRNSRQQIEDQDDLEMDSVLRALGRSENDEDRFVEKVMSGIESAPQPTDAATLPGFTPLMEKANALAESKTRAQKGIPTSSSFNANAKRLGFGFAIAASICVPILMTVWFVGTLINPTDSMTRNDNPHSPAIEQAGTQNAAGLNETRKPASEITPDLGVDDRKSTPKLVMPNRGPNGATDSMVGDHLNSKPRSDSFNATKSDWRLTVNFDESGSGKAKLNNHELKNGFSISDADLVVGRINYEVVRRVCFLSPILDDPWTGNIEINGPTIAFQADFESLAEMQDVLVESARKLAEASSKLNSIGSSRTYPSQLPVVDEVISNSELILREMAPKFVNKDDFLFLDLSQRTNAARFKFYRTIESEDLAHFSLTGELRVPEPTETFLAQTSIQDLDVDALGKKLDTSVPAVDMFENIAQFQNARGQILNLTASGRVRNKIQLRRSAIDDLRKQIRETSDADEIKKIRRRIGKHAREWDKLQNQFDKLASDEEPPGEPIEPLVSLLPNRPDLQQLPLVMGKACHLSKENSVTLDHVSKSVGPTLAAFDAFGSRDFNKHDGLRMKALKLAIHNIARGPNPEQALRTLDQMLQMERPELRLELVSVLRESCSTFGHRLLACYAKYDLASSVRMAATDALRSFPPESYRGELLAGLDYPWPVVAKHSAEALVRLNDIDAIPDLVELLKSPDPRTPKQLSQNEFVQRELVAVNHMRNCTLCHADSQNPKDPGRALVPNWGERLPQKYYQAQRGAMVRADITYLRQDFSVIHRVKDAAPWPEHQRFDYLVRATRLSTDQARIANQAFKNRTNEYHEIVGQTLRMLTDEDPDDDTYETWQAVIRKRHVPQ